MIRNTGSVIHEPTRISFSESSSKMWVGRAHRKSQALLLQVASNKVRHIKLLEWKELYHSAFDISMHIIFINILVHSIN